MSYHIKELRKFTGLSQSEFARKFDIPVSTLRKWEQGESKPAGYIIKLIAKEIPATEESLREISGTDGKKYYYDELSNFVIDSLGNRINVSESISGVNLSNLAIYITDLYEHFYEIRDRFNRDLKYDKLENIIWTREEK